MFLLMKLLYLFRLQPGCQTELVVFHFIVTECTEVLRSEIYTFLTVILIVNFVFVLEM